MKKYLKLYLAFLRSNIMKRLAYRADFSLSVLLVSFESLTVVLAINIIFGHIDSIAGWSYDQMLVLIGIFMLTHALAWMFYKGGVGDLDKVINSGDLDWHLVRPVDPQFMITIQRIDLEDAARSLVGIVVMGYGLRHTPFVDVLAALPLFIITILAGTMVMYSITLTVKSISFKSIQGWASSSIYWRFHDLARYPTDIYRGFMAFVYTFIFPLVFIATVPAKSFTGQLTMHLFFGSILAAVIAFIISRYIWKKALKGYSSASS